MDKEQRKSNIDIDVLLLLKILYKRKIQVGILFAISLVTFGVLSTTVQPTYSSTIRVETNISNVASTRSTRNECNLLYVEQMKNYNVLKPIIDNMYSLTDEQRNNIQLDTFIKQYLDIKIEPETNIIKITGKSSDAEEAKMIANSVAVNFLEFHNNMDHNVSASVMKARLEYDKSSEALNKYVKEHDNMKLESVYQDIWEKINEKSDIDQDNYQVNNGNRISGEFENAVIKASEKSILAKMLDNDERVSGIPKDVLGYFKLRLMAESKYELYIATMKKDEQTKIFNGANGTNTYDVRIIDAEKQTLTKSVPNRNVIILCGVAMGVVLTLIYGGYLYRKEYCK